MGSRKKKVVTFVKKKSKKSKTNDTKIQTMNQTSTVHTNDVKPIRVKYYKNRRKRVRKEIKNIKDE